MLVEFERLKEQPVSEDELSRAKGYIAGVTKIRHQTNGNRCVELARDELFGLGLDFTDRYLAEVAKVSADDLLRVARTYFDPERYAIGVLRGRDGD